MRVYVGEVFMFPGPAACLHSVRTTFEKSSNATEFVRGRDNRDFGQFGGDYLFRFGIFACITVDLHFDL